MASRSQPPRGTMLLMTLGLPLVVIGAVFESVRYWPLVGPGAGLLVIGAGLFGAAIERSKH